MWESVAAKGVSDAAQAALKPVGSDSVLKGQNNFDSSGWNVNFGTGGIESSRAQTGELSDYVRYALIAGAVLIAWRFTRKK